MNYLISFIYKQSIHYCIWVSDDEDYVITKDGKILFFSTIDLIEEYEKKHNIIVSRSEEVQYNLDKMLLWCFDEDDIECCCDEILNLWNISHDVANSIKKYFIGNAPIYDELYEKIFSANDLFSSNPIPCDSLSEFSKSEIMNIKKIIKNGIETIVESI